VDYQSVLILGLGKSGREAAFLLKEKGAEVTVAELKEKFSTLQKKKELERFGVRVIFGSHRGTLLKKKNLVILSPGVSNDLPIVKKARSLNIPVISELDFASRFIPRKNLIAITGTNGKTTTAFLTYKILKKSELSVKLGGNIGIPLSRLARSSFSLNSSCRIVTEVSSFQLEMSPTFSPHIYCVLNISPDHLDRHSSFSEYRKIKAAPLFRMKKDDFAILNYDQYPVKSLGNVTQAKVIFFSQRQKLNEGLFIDNNRIVANIGKTRVHIPLDNLQPHKFHNWENVLCAVACALIEKVTPELIRDSLLDYKPLPHRQQLIEEIDGVKFIDDSKATNRAAVENLVGSLTSPAVLIMGGKDKGDDFSSLKRYFPGKVKNLIVIGEAKNRIKRQLEGAVPIMESSSLKEAVRLAFSLSEKGGLVVLCPGCSSFDEFISYRHRGRVFKKEVKKLKKEIEEKNSV